MKYYELKERGLNYDIDMDAALAWTNFCHSDLRKTFDDAGLAYIFDIKVSNRRNCPANYLAANEQGMNIWNKLVKPIMEHGEKAYNPHMFSAAGTWLKNRFGWFIAEKQSGYQLYVKTSHLMFTALFSCFTKNVLAGNEYGGRNSFLKIREELKKDGIILEDYAVENGKEIKNSIPSPYIELGRNAETKVIYEHCHHLDFHSAYASALSELHPEMAPTYDRLMVKRSESPEMKKIIKSVFTNSIGFFQSEYCRAKVRGKSVDYAYANLAYDAISWTLNRIIELRDKLEDAGYMPLLFNTDGIWYVKKKKGKCVKSDPFTNDARYGAKTALRTFGNDHIDCTLRIKSKGAYEYIEDGSYHPVVRGQTKLDRIKPRDQWQWGDIFNEGAQVLRFKLNDSTALIEMR